MKLNATKKLLIKLITIAIVLSLFVTCAPIFGNSGENAYAAIKEQFNYDKQWFAKSNYLDYEGTLATLKQQNIVSRPEYYRENPIVIAVIDTGIWLSHPVFEGLLYENKAEKNGVKGKDDDGNKYIDDVCGWDFVAGDSNPSDECDVAGSLASHGTHVAGTIAQAIIAYGLQDYIKILPIRAGSRSASFMPADTISAIGYATNLGANIINMSFGKIKSADWKEGTQLHSAIKSVSDKGVLLFAAAGNSGDYSLTTGGFYPAAFNEVYGVMAYDTVGQLRTSSNYGKKYDFVAPGEDIYSAMRNDLYDYKNGTSMACPMVSLMSAVLMLKFNSEVDIVREVLERYSADTIEKVITSSGDTTVTESYRLASLKQMLEYRVPIYRVNIEKTFGENAQTLGKTQLTKFVGTIYDFNNAAIPENDEAYNDIVWSAVKKVGTKKIEVASGIGHLFEFKPSEVGDYEVYFKAKSTNKASEIIKLEVNYATLRETGFSVSLNVDKPQTGKQNIFTLNEYKNLNPNSAPAIYWYVNGEQVPTAMFDTFVFVPEKLGKYNIVCKIANDETIANFNVYVQPSIDEIAKIIVYIVVGFANVAAVLLIILSIKRQFEDKQKK
ncbi:MAG: S8 family serine peptidase [Clostridia bacterium]